MNFSILVFFLALSLAAGASVGPKPIDHTQHPHTESPTKSKSETPAPNAKQTKPSEQSTNDKEKLGDLIKNCSAKTKVNPEQVAQLRGNSAPITDSQKCFLECLYTEVGILKDGAVNLEGAKKLASKHLQPTTAKQFEEAFESCAKKVTKKDSEKCSSAAALRDCFTKQNLSIESHLLGQ